MLKIKPFGRRAAAGAALAFVTLAGTPAPDALATPAAAPPRILIEGGALRTWDGVATDLHPLPKWITVRMGAPLATLTLDDGHLIIILGKAGEVEGRGQHKRDGAALVLGWPGGSSADLGFRSQFSVAFQGMPLVATGTEEHAWVYTREFGASQEAAGRAWVHDIDLTAGRVSDSTFLPGTVGGLAVEPEGGRLFVGLDDRVLSLTTRPLVTSWHYRSPGPNGPLAMSPDGRLLAALRGQALALFDASEIAARTATERRGRVDDATRAVALERPPHGLAFSDDGRLVAVFGTDRVEYFDAGSGARLGEERLPGVGEAGELRPLRFPGGGSDLVVVALPSGAVAALPCPEPLTRRTATPLGGDAAPAVESPVAVAGAPAAASVDTPPLPSATEPPPTPEPSPAKFEPAAPAAAPAPGEAPAPVAEKVPVSAAEAPPEAPPAAAAQDAAPAVETKPDESPATKQAPSEQPATEDPATEQPASEPPPPDTPPAGPPTLSGRIGGTSGIVRSVVIYGPSSIIREYWRTKVESEGTWSMPLPPPGSYRVVPVGDGSTPIPVRPGFLSIVVEAGKAQAGLDFKAGTGN